MSPRNKKDPPSSYPGIYKYPSGRDVLLQTWKGWLDSKRIDDEIGPFWRVHDSIYDLDSFAEKHPGGSDWIHLTRGTDITEAFEIHHVINVKYVETTLAKYFVRKANHPRNSPYTFKENGFYKSLKRRIEPILKKSGTGASRQVKLIQDSLLLGFLVTAFAGILANSTILQIISGVILALSTISAHSFFHQRDSTRLFYFDFSLLSSLEWRITHSLSHHAYANTVLDAEISMFEPMLQFLPKPGKSILNRKGLFYLLPLLHTQILYIVTFWTEFLRRIGSILKGSQSPRPENFIVLFQLVAFCLASESIWSGCTSWLFIHTVSSYTFLLIGLNAAHHSPEIFHDGDEARKDPDFGLCQLDAVRDRSDAPFRHIFVNMVSFGEHSLHHLFPTVCYSKFPLIKQIYKDTLSEFHEEFPPISQLDHFLGTLRQLDRTQPRSLDKKLKNK